MITFTESTGEVDILSLAICVISGIAGVPLFVIYVIISVMRHQYFGSVFIFAILLLFVTLLAL